MREERLIQNIIDQMKEVQLKLGYAKESTRLYFPWESFAGILDTDCSGHQKLLGELNENPVFREGKLGKIRFRESGGRVEVTIPPDGAEYVHRDAEEPAFLSALIRLFGSHHRPSIEEIQECFSKFAEYVCIPSECADFDYVIYFRDPSEDSYYYCIKTEMGHTVYHRFMKEDYERLME